MISVDWVAEYPGAVTVCDAQGIILYMNQRAVKVLSVDGQNMVGQNLLECHPEPARTKLVEMLQTQTTNTYTIEKNGVKKLLHQSPWYNNGCYMGFVEQSFEIPLTMDHIIRVPKTK